MNLARLIFAVVVASAPPLSAVAAKAPVLTPDGWGSLRIGMREADAVRRLGLVVAPENDVDSYACRNDSYPGQPGMSVMAEGGFITRIVISRPSHLNTDKGFGIGAREREIRQVYGRDLKVETRAYEDEPAHDLTYWVSSGRDKKGVRYGTDAHGRVVAIYVGSKSIEYIEGCL